ncbi:MAG: DegQ family serine endoprotease [Pyrinomonadaceae bacterium MAG19_C2-C3]|nr:DegQ family serine endoprotease [Pyrinomonadaceae bacterium MAG19_C2-C3]
MDSPFKKSNLPSRSVQALALALAVSSPFVASQFIESSSSLANPASVAVVDPQNSYADVVGRVSPAVVTVNSSGRAASNASRNPLLEDPALREFFGGRIPQQPRRTRGLGSGIIVTADGYILTNNHVVDDADRVTITLNDRRVLDAKVIGTDPASDLAVLKVNATNLPVLPLGNSDGVRVGDVALAIGNPLGVGQTVTSGIISAKNRQSFGAGSAESFEEFIQTDAPINQGNSGGALINTNGELIGINSQILSPSGGNIGIGFAIPSNMAKNVMDQLVKNGKVRRGFLGIGLQDVTSDIAAARNLTEVRGAIVNSVQPSSPASTAGLRRGDVVTALNGTPVTDSNNLRNRIAATQPGAQVTFTVRRDAGEQQFRATLGERPTETARGGSATPERNNAAPETGKLGITVQPLTPELARDMDLRDGTQGLIVANVDPDSPAAEAGLRKGDILEEVNGQQVRLTTDLRTALDRSPNRPLLMLIRRGENTVFVTVRPQQS